MKYIYNISLSTIILRGPCGVSVVLDASEMFPGDPGNGCPVLCRYNHDGRSESMSWGCAVEGGNWIDAINALTGDEEAENAQAICDCHSRWFDAISEELGEWESHHWKIAKRNAHTLA